MDANWPPLQFVQGCADAERRITSSVIEALNAALCETNNNMALLTSKALAADSVLAPAPLQLKLTGLDLHFKRSFFAAVLDDWITKRSTFFWDHGKLRGWEAKWQRVFIWTSSPDRCISKQLECIRSETIFPRIRVGRSTGNICCQDEASKATKIGSPEPCPTKKKSISRETATTNRLNDEARWTNAAGELWTGRNVVAIHRLPCALLASFKIQLLMIWQR